MARRQGAKSRRGPFSPGGRLHGVGSHGVGEVLDDLQTDRYLTEPTIAEAFQFAQTKPKPARGRSIPKGLIQQPGVPIPAEELVDKMIQTGEPDESRSRLTEGEMRRIIDETKLPAQLAVTQTPRVILPTLRRVGVNAVQLDTDLEDRIDILIWNVSDVLIWINTSRNITAAANGIPLASNTAVGAYDGASISIECTKEVEWYGVAAGGANNLVVVIESAR